MNFLLPDVVGLAFDLVPAEVHVSCLVRAPSSQSPALCPLLLPLTIHSGLARHTVASRPRGPSRSYETQKKTQVIVHYQTLCNFMVNKFLKADVQQNHFITLMSFYPTFIRSYKTETAVSLAQKVRTEGDCQLKLGSLKLAPKCSIKAIINIAAGPDDGQTNNLQ